jgi:hypothetical protein
VDGAFATLAVQKIGSKKMISPLRFAYLQQAKANHFFNAKFFLMMSQAPATAVSQLAKMPCPTLKALPTKGLEVRQQSKPSYAYAPTQENNSHFENIDLKKATDFITLVKALYPLYSVAFRRNIYLENHFTNCRKQALDLFLSLVETFTLLHHQHRATAVENVLEAAHKDYEDAYKLWLCCQPKKAQPLYVPTLQRVLQFLQYRYHDKTFTITKIAAQLNYSAAYIGRILIQLQQQKHIEALPYTAKNETRFFQLIHKLQ